MPPPKQNFSKPHVALDRGDLALLKEIFGSTIGVSAAIRIAIRRFLSDHEALSREIINAKQKETQAATSNPTPRAETHHHE